MPICTVCGCTSFQRAQVLWKELISDWQLSPQEVDYINRQQGESCTNCGSNLRSIALADAISCHFSTTQPLLEFVISEAAAKLVVLELNGAGTLTSALSKLPNYTYGEYPEVDMHALPYKDATFDVVVHSDTLEHVPNPIHALEECKRVLKKGGALCLTVPIVVGRMTRTREGLPKSYHGNSETGSDDLVVQTEFGADAWTFLMEAGFRHISMHTVEYPAAIAMRAVA
jgi:SAM-dependent methyltransferase